MLFHLPPLGIAVRTIHRPFCLGVRFGLVHQVRHPGRDRLDDDLRAFALKEFEHVEVAVAFGDLRPEFARDLHHRLHLGAIHFDGVHLFARRSQCIQIVLAPHMFVHLAEHVKGVAQNLVALELGLGPVGGALFDLERVAISQVVAKAVHRLAEHAIGFALVHFKGTNLVNQIVEHVAQVHGVQHAESEIDRELQSGLARRRLDAVAVFEQQHAEAIKTGILQREAVFRLVHAEAAGTARTGRKENVIVQNLLARECLPSPGTADTAPGSRP